MTITEHMILSELRDRGPQTADDLAVATRRGRETVLRSTRRMWLGLTINRESILTGTKGRPRMRYMLGLGADRGHP